MKKKLFFNICFALAVFFLLVIAIVFYFYKINPLENMVETIALISLFVVVIPLMANELSYRIISRALKPVDSFVAYISNIILNNVSPDRQYLDIEAEEEILAYLRKYDYDISSIKQGLDRLRYSSGVRKEFSANVSHELKSPLTSINGYAEMIANGMAKDEEIKRFAQIINDEGNRLLRLINETIELSKIDNNYIKTDSLSYFEFSDIVEEIIDSMVKAMKDKGIVCSYKPNKIKFYGNKKLIGDLVANLVSNAVKYSRGEDAFINIDVFEDKKNITLTVEDNGIGIGESEQERVFERFYVVDKSRGNKTGTGLGLSLVKNIALYHKGSVSLESKLGQGSKFTVILPKLSEKDYF